MNELLSLTDCMSLDTLALGSNNWLRQPGPGFPQLATPWESRELDPRVVSSPGASPGARTTSIAVLLFLTQPPSTNGTSLPSLHMLSLLFPIGTTSGCTVCMVPDRAHIGSHRPCARCLALATPALLRGEWLRGK
jgi:hypothetical protein